MVILEVLQSFKVFYGISDSLAWRLFGSEWFLKGGSFGILALDPEQVALGGGESRQGQPGVLTLLRGPQHRAAERRAACVGCRARGWAGWALSAQLPDWPRTCQGIWALLSNL